VADTILDRIVHDAHRIDLLGESLRKTQKNKITEDIETESNYINLYNANENKEMILFKKAEVE
jgi:hypothetical protein